MQVLYLNIGFSLLLILTSVPTGESAIIPGDSFGHLIQGLWARLERIFDSTLLRGPLKILQNLPGVKLVRTTVRFLIKTVVKLPFEATLKVFDFVCKTLTDEGLIGKSGVIKAGELAITLIDDEGKDRIVLTSLPKIISSSRFIADRNLTIFIPGWSSKGEGEFDTTTELLVNAFNNRLDRNFGVFDLGTSFDNLYTWSAYNAREIGNLLGLHLSKLSDKIPAENIHLIGAGLGAQVAGFAGKRYESKTSKLLGRVTGLDPSRPCFGNSGLDRSSAKFVDIIHSSKLFGSLETKGHADFYTNRISTVLPTKGCDSFFCLHQQAVRYFAESIMPGQEKNFCGVQCASRTRFDLGQCEDGESVTMGLMVSENARGAFYLNTNLNSPYGQCVGETALEPEENGEIVGNEANGGSGESSGNGGSDNNGNGAGDKGGNEGADGEGAKNGGANIEGGDNGGTGNGEENNGEADNGDKQEK